MQCYEMQAMLIQLKTSLGDQARDLEHLCIILEKLGVTNFGQLQALSPESIQSASGIDISSFDRAA